MGLFWEQFLQLNFFKDDISELFITRYVTCGTEFETLTHVSLSFGRSHAGPVLKSSRTERAVFDLRSLWRFGSRYSGAVRPCGLAAILAWDHGCHSSVVCGPMTSFAHWQTHFPQAEVFVSVLAVFWKVTHRLTVLLTDSELCDLEPRNPLGQNTKLAVTTGP